MSELEEHGYKPGVVVSDGGTGIASALHYFEISIHQRCHVHIMRDMRTGFRMPKRRMKSTLRKYYLYKYAKLVLDSRSWDQRKIRWKQFERVVLKMWPPQGDAEKNVVKAFVYVQKKAFTFLTYPHLDIPITTNRIEGYISNLNTRLKTMRGLKSSANAELLLNAVHFFLTRL